MTDVTEFRRLLNAMPNGAADAGAAASIKTLAHTAERTYAERKDERDAARQKVCPRSRRLL